MKPTSTHNVQDERAANKGSLYGGLIGALLATVVAGLYGDAWNAWHMVAMLIGFVLTGAIIGHCAVAASRRRRSPDDEWADSSVWDRLADMGNTLDAGE